jgi:hypothetical protein
MGAPKRALPPALAANPWGQGQSGNHSGHSGEYGQAMRLASQAAPYAVQRLSHSWTAKTSASLLSPVTASSIAPSAGPRLGPSVGTVRAAAR